MPGSETDHAPPILYPDKRGGPRGRMLTYSRAWQTAWDDGWLACDQVQAETREESAPLVSSELPSGTARADQSQGAREGGWGRRPLLPPPDREPPNGGAAP
jgi:hypothetical protein